MIFNFGKKESKETDKIQLHLAVDIGTEYVKSVIYSIENKEIQVLGYSRLKQKEDSMYGAFILDLDFVTDVVDRSVGEAISMAEELLENVPFHLPKKAEMGIAGELIQGVTVLVNIDRSNPDKEITTDEIQKVVNQVKKSTFNSTKEEIAEEIGISPSQILEINTFINSVYIDGNKSNNPEGFTGKEILYRVFSTFAPKIHIDSLKNVSKSLNIKETNIIVEPYALSLALEGIRKPGSNAIFIDIGGGTTDVAVVINGDIMGTKMFAIGGKVFTKRLEKDFNLDYQEAEARKIAYANGELNDHDTLAVKKALTKDISVWLTGVQIALEDFEDISEFPTDIYLCGGGALLPDIQEGLISHPWLQVLNFKKFPKVHFFFPNKVRSVVDKTRKATMPMDVTPLALARMSLDN